MRRKMAQAGRAQIPEANQMTFYVIARLFPYRFFIENRWLTISLVG